jgi:hypothetical protein
MKRSITALPLHTGRAPRWLFERMKKLSAAIASLVIIEFGPREFARRMADPVWFQAFGCVVGFDWHSSGVTTTLCGALKEGLTASPDLPVAICGGKGKRSLKTPEELTHLGETWDMDTSPYVSLSRLCAKVDNSLVQDGYRLYHHTFLLTRDGDWAIVQQGMNGDARQARRYQWFSRDGLDAMCEPHTGVTCDHQGTILNLVAAESAATQNAVVDFVEQDPDRMSDTWKKITLSMPERHYIAARDFDQPRLEKMFRVMHEAHPGSFRDLVQLRGVGPRTLAALALVSELVYEAPPSFRDPARFSFAHGGKDGHPFPVDRTTYDSSIEFLQTCLDRAQVADREKIDAFRRLANYERATHAEASGG